MNASIAMDSNNEHLQNKPGAKLALIRQQKGYSAEYVAGKLHLRVNIIELLEADDYYNMPEAVFIKGYLRAYAKLLDMVPEPFIETFNQCYSNDRKTERALWQSRRQTYKTEHTARWVTGFFAVVVFIAVFVWWNNKETDVMFPATTTTTVKEVSQVMPAPSSEKEIRLTDLSKMRSLLSSVSQIVPVENPSE
jgi:cytoskeleton protein RodZ